MHTASLCETHSSTGMAEAPDYMRSALLNRGSVDTSLILSQALEGPFLPITLPHML
jgi:hypothetical protein